MPLLRPLQDSGGVETAGRATSTIAELVNRLVDENVRDMTKNLNDALVVEHHMELDVMHTYITNENDKSSVIFEEVMEDRKKRIASGGDNARAKMEAKRLEAQKAFVDEGLNLKPKMEARQKYQLAIDELRKGALTHDLTNPMCDLSAVENESKRETLILAQLQMIDRAIKAVYGTGLGQFDQKASSVGEDKPKVSDLMVPHHIEKGKGEEFGTMIVRYTGERLSSYYIIHRYIKRIVSDRVEGSFWKPPTKSEDFVGVAKWEYEEYKRQSKLLWDQMKLKIPKEIFVSITQPEPSGYYGVEDTVCGEVDDGVLAVYVLMTLYRPNDSDHVSDLQDFMANTPYLVLSPRANLKKVIDDIAAPLEEVVALGVKIPWKTSGQAFIDTLIKAQPVYQPYLHQYRLMATDPEDSATHFKVLLAKVKGALKAITRSDKYQGGYARDYNAYDTTCDIPVYEVCSTDDGWTVSENPSTSKYEGYYNNGYAFDTNAFYECEDQDWDYPTDASDYSPESPIEAYHDASDHSALVIPSTAGELQAFYTQSKGKGWSKGARKGKGRSKGKGKGKGNYSFPKGGKGNAPFSPNPPYIANVAEEKSAHEAQKGGFCAAKGCKSTTNPSFTYCYPCHQEGKEKGFIIDKDNRKVTVPKKVQNDGKRAFEAFLEGISEEEMQGILGHSQTTLNANATEIEQSQSSAEKLKSFLAAKKFRV